MSEDYFGWRPVSVPYPYGNSDYVTVDHSDPNQRYEPTVWSKDTTNIETMWGWIQNESDERVLAVAEMWRRITVLLESTRDNLQRYATALAAKWQSPAGEYFMERVGATLYSLDEWREAADSNYRGLEQLASTIKTAQQNFRPLWEQYIVVAADPDKGWQWSDTYDWIPGLTGRTRQDVMDEFFDRARDIMKPLADTYIDVYISHITRGTMFKGPTDAAVNHPQDIPAPNPFGPPPGAPPGGGPGAPPGGPRPGLPGGPGPDALAPPQLPDGLNLAGGAVTAPAPPPGSVVPPPGAGPAPSPPPAVVPPGGSPIGPRPGSPGLGRPNLPPTPGGNRPTAPTRPPGPPRPALPGAGAPSQAKGPAARGPAPKPPTLPGSTGPNSGARPPAPGSRPPVGRGTPPTGPQLPGSTSGRPARPAGSAGRPATPPPSLGGQRPAAKPTASGPRLPGPATPGAAGRAAPVKPQLPGRAGPAKPGSTAGKGPAPTLGGQRGQTPTGSGARQHRKSDDQQQSWAYGDGDDELWETESTATGTIDTPVEKRPTEQGRSLGQQ
ncbi:WXG100 family type VII secretion target [Micromonospora sp. NBC_01813]|uniref:WXG100 family type VII secretion target n=1 Tax=Micromonospora sp. NBC_01813 TaxID=2975988 RepID=UPI002DD960A1|nr:hypothetical protein [Micromonospora sp. NBC_01813]WSA07246.1 hypothetical protein OG958_23720 [Micromonospora sp. NBC_01813]